jgi:predicted RNA polymerase sigma factor
VARGELLRQLGRNDDAAREFRTALEMTQVEGERRLLVRRLEEVRRI